MPETATLFERWVHRDHRYALRRQAMSDADVRAIRAYRHREAEEIGDRVLMALALRWEPPLGMWRHG